MAAFISPCYPMYFDSKNNAIVSTYQPLPSIKASISVLQDNPED